MGYNRKEKGRQDMKDIGLGALLGLGAVVLVFSVAISGGLFVGACWIVKKFFFSD